jgi:hypothetical protein
MPIDHNALLSTLIFRCFTIIFWVVRFLTQPPFECAFKPSFFFSALLSHHLLGSALSSPHFLSSHHILGSAFFNPTSFRVRL